MESKQSPMLAYRIPDDVSKEDRDALNKRIKDIAKARRLNYFELLSFWANNDYLLDGVEQTVKPNVNTDITQAILNRLNKLEEILIPTQLELPFIDVVKHNIEQKEPRGIPNDKDIKHNIKQIIKHNLTQKKPNSNALTKEEIIAKVKILHSQGKNSMEIAEILTEEKITTPTGKSVWSSRTIRDWMKVGK